MVRKCSHCGNIGHNSRTCTNYKPTTTTFVGRPSSSLRLFGVQLDLINNSSSSILSNNNNNIVSSSISIKKSFSMDCLVHSSTSSPSSSYNLSNSSRISLDDISHHDSNASIGYLSDGLIGRPQERKKGVPWTEGEHRTFLVGLEKLGKGDWRGISRNYVTTRTPTQVASHAQKYFLRLASQNNKKRRSSLFDMVGNNNNDHPNIPNPKLQHLALSNCPIPSRHQQSMPVWLHGLIDSKIKSNPNNTAKFLPTSSNTAPDLELKLAGPRPNLEPTKPSQGHLLVGPITVT